MQQQGSFISGESWTSSVTTDTAGGTILSTTGSVGNRKNFARDVKQIFMDTTTGLDYTSDINLTDSKQIAGTIDATGTAVVGYNTKFSTDLVVGDILEMPTGAAGALEELSLIHI